MGSPLFCTPNYLKSTYFTPIIGGGDWDVNNWLDKIADKYFINKAISTDATTASTQFQVDLAVMRDVKAFIIPNSNIDNDGLIRVRASNTVAWTNVTVNGVNALNATTLNVTAGATDATIAAKELFKIAGDTQLYEVVTGATITAGNNDSITIQRTGDSGTGLAAATTGSEAITCHSGDYTNDLRADTTQVDYRAVIYGLTDPFGSPTIWLGKETEENINTLNLPNPFIYVFSNIVLARYWKVEIDNTTNSDNYVSIDDCFIASGFIPATGIGLGAVMGIKSNSTSEKSAGGVETFDSELSGRYIDMDIPGLSVDESLTNIFDMQRKLDVSDDFFFIFDVDDTILKTRRSFVARFEQLGGQRFVAYDWVDSKMRIKEKLG
jgi:hypothetical protein